MQPGSPTEVIIATHTERYSDIHTYIYIYLFFVLPVRVVISVAQGLHPRSLELTVFASIDCRCGCILRHFHKIQIRPSSSQKNNHFSQKRDQNPGSGPAGFNAPSVDFKVVHGLTGGLSLSLGLYTCHAMTCRVLKCWLKRSRIPVF